MLVVCNGPFKSGSTWLYEIARRLVEPEPMPREFVASVWLPVETIPHNDLARFVAEADLAAHDYVVKEHMGRPRRVRFLVESPDVVLVDIKRDLRDVAVSSFHHFRALKDDSIAFPEFYWSVGRYYVAGVANHHRRWVEFTALTVGYEALLTDFESEVSKLASVLGRSVSTAEIGEIREQVGIKELRAQYADSGIAGMQSSQFFRSGSPGGWVDYLDDEMLADIERIGESWLPLPQRVGWAIRSRARRVREPA